MLHPTRRLVWLAAAPLVLSVAAVAFPRLLPWLMALDGAIVAIAALDAFLGWRLGRGLAAEIHAPRVWSLGAAQTVEVRLDNPGRAARRLEALPDVPGDLGLLDAAVTVAVPGRSRAGLAFRCRPRRRGGYRLEGVHLAVASPGGLWRRRLRLGAVAEIHVHPDLQQLTRYALLARTDRLSLIGVRRSRRAGGDTEFARLRDWMRGDPLSRMDWKATARRDRPTARDYRTSENQSLVLLVDAGRMMTSEADAGGRNLLDLAIDAALMLAWVAVRQGDRVGLVAYADGVRRWVPPRGGPQQVARLVHALHDLHAERVESRHEDAFLHLDRHCRKRSLVVCLTHVLDEVNADHLERHCHRLVGRHLPLAVLLRDHALHDRLPEREQLAAALARDPQALWTAGAAASIITWREEVIARLRGHGCLVLDAPSEKLTAQLVSRYLEVKARHLL